MKRQPQDVIKDGIERHGKEIAVSCSGGKDSMVVLHMALQVDPNIHVVFANTGVEFPETVRYMREMKERWDLNLTITKPIKTFFECWEQYGPPAVRGCGTARVPKCCIYTKEKPLGEAFKKLGLKATFTGLTAMESRQRMMLIYRYENSEKEHNGISFNGQRYYAKYLDRWIYHPIAYWKEEEVWDYMKKNDIPINPVYLKWNGLYPRCGCLTCTAYISWEERLSISHPKIYRFLKKKLDPQQRDILSFTKAVVGPNTDSG